MSSSLDTTKWPKELKYAPIVSAPYNRLLLFQQVIAALQKNTLASQSALFLFCDAPGRKEDIAAVNAVREYARTITGFLSVIIIEREKNYGGIGNLADGLTHISEHYGRYICLEDDIITSPYFLKYMNDCLILYKDEPKISAICSYRPPFKRHTESPFFLQHYNPWGAAQWIHWHKKNLQRDAETSLNELKQRKLMKKFMRYSTSIVSESRMLQMTAKKIMNAIDVIHSVNVFLNDNYCVYPPRSLSNHAGFGDGVHCTVPADEFTTILSSSPIEVGNFEIKEDPRLVKSYHSWLLKTHLKLLFRYIFGGFFIKKFFSTYIMHKNKKNE